MQPLASSLAIDDPKVRFSEKKKIQTKLRIMVDIALTSKDL